MTAGIVQGKRIAVIFNPAAGRRRRRRLEEVLDELRLTGHDIQLRETRARGDAERIAGEIARADTSDDIVDVLAVAGGDGTIGEVVNGLMAAPDSRRPVLALIPLGTANVLATEIGLSRSARAIAATIAAGTPASVHTGMVNGRCFTMMVGAGFDAETVAAVDLDLKRRIGWLAYVVAMLGVARRFGAPRYRVTVDGRGHDAASVIVTRGRCYGGPFLLAPEAGLLRPELHVCLFERGGLWHSIRYGLALLIGLLPRLSGFRIVGGTIVTIEGPAGARLQGDGDLIGELPARIELSQTPLMLLLPSAAVRAKA